MSKKIQTRTFAVTVPVVRSWPQTEGNDITTLAIREALRFNTHFHRRRIKVTRTRALSDGQIVEIANERHRAMPAGADDQDEMLAIVRDCLMAAGLPAK